jgi:sulfatase modifying factor 1
VALKRDDEKARREEADPKEDERKREENVVAEASITNSIGMKLHLIPAGAFQMGSSVPARTVAQQFGMNVKNFLDEHPRHEVLITRPFYLGQHEVTIAQFRQFVVATAFRTEAEQEREGGMGFNPSTGRFNQDPKYTWKNPGFSQEDDHPVVNVSWNDAMAFCSWLSRREGAEYRLPTEAEWEFSCRGNTTTLFHHGNDPEGLALVGNVKDGTLNAELDDATGISAEDGYIFTGPVGRFRSNTFGLSDMHGNVWEWCQDYFGEYPSSLVTDPTGPKSGRHRVFRGGGWCDPAGECRSAFRLRNFADYRSSYLGFRVVRSSGKSVPEVE